MIKKFIVTAISFLGVSILALAHEFWIQPSRFWTNVGETIRLTVLVGESFEGERWDIKKSRLISYRHYFPNDSTDLTAASASDQLADAEVKLNQPGTHLISLFNTNRYLAMRADSFLLYLKEDGLDDVIRIRQERGDSDKRSREMYRRCVKTLIQVGPNSATPDNIYARNTGMPLEIIPIKNPYRQRLGEEAEFQIMFNNQPVAGALVRYWNRDADNHLVEEKQRSDARGRVRFKLRAGRNMVSLVKMVPYEDRSKADWQSYWGSLTFGCR